MSLGRRDVLKLLASSFASAGVARRASARHGAPLERDVCVIGGGSAGTYAALRLRDMGYSVAVLERAQRLGGHCETYRDPASGAPIDIGVIVFPDNSLVRNYFARFDVPLITSPSRGGSNRHVDFRTGTAVDAYTPPAADLGAALTSYLALLESRFSFLEHNGYQLPGPGPVLDELRLPFGEFAQRFGLTALLPTFFQFEQGYGSLLDATSLYVLKNMSVPVVRSVLTRSFLTAPAGAGTLYERATAELGSDVLFGSALRSVQRHHRRRLQVVVDTPECRQIVHCQKLLFTAPPLLHNLRDFDLDHQERSVFGRFRPNYYWTAVARVANFPSGVSLVNAAPETPFNLAPPPGLYSVSPSPAPSLVNIKYGSATPLSDRDVRAAMRADIERVRLPGVEPLTLEEFAIFKNHSPYSLMVSPAEIGRGFYDDLQALQGRNDTFYASAAFQTHNSAAIWAYLEELLPTLFA